MTGKCLSLTSKFHSHNSNFKNSIWTERTLHWTIGYVEAVTQCALDVKFWYSYRHLMNTLIVIFIKHKNKNMVKNDLPREDHEIWHDYRWLWKGMYWKHSICLLNSLYFLIDNVYIFIGAHSSRNRKCFLISRYMLAPKLRGWRSLQRMLQK
jgi:hypothetical protein